MAVRTEDTHAGSQVVSADALARHEPKIYRAIGIGLWLFSFTGNVLAFGGGPVALDNATLQAIGISLVWQLICTVVQFVSCKHPWSIIYQLALFASAIPSLIGYRVLIAVPIAEWLGVIVDPFESRGLLSIVSVESILIAGAVHFGVLLALVLADIIPERIFVKH